MAGLENLPNDILCSYIFIRLPAKQLARMRCCSKHLNALLSQPSFVKSHLRRSIHDNDENILLLFYRYNNFTTHPSRSPHLTNTIDFVKLPVNVLLENGACTVIGSINGLICLSVYRSKNTYVIYIWNPSLSALLALPQYGNNYPHRNPIDVQFRFGYDPKTDDYKVVKLTKLLTLAARCYFYATYVYSLVWVPAAKIDSAIATSVISPS